MTMNGAQQPRCTCCGQPVPDLPRLDSLVVALGLKGDMRRLFTIFSAARGRYLKINELVEIMWGDAKNGGPENADKSLHVLIFRLRERLLTYPVALEINQENGLPTRLVARAQWTIARVPGGFGYQFIPEAA